MEVLLKDIFKEELLFRQNYRGEIGRGIAFHMPLGLFHLRSYGAVRLKLFILRNDDAGEQRSMAFDKKVQPNLDSCYAGCGCYSRRL